MSRADTFRLARHVVSVAVAAVFIYASISKIQEPDKFATQLRYYKLFPLWSLHLLALTIPWWELIAGFAVLIPALRKGASIVLFLLSFAFFVSVSQALARGLSIECGCFGTESGKIGWAVLALDVSLLMATVFLLRGKRRGEQGAHEPSPATA